MVRGRDGEEEPHDHTRTGLAPSHSWKEKVVRKGPEAI